MKRLLTLTVCVLMMIASPAQAEGTSIGVVDVIYIMSNAKAANHVEEQRNSLREKFLAEIAEAEKKLRDQEKSLIEERGKVSKEEYIEKRKAYEEQLLKTRRYAQTKKRAIEAAANTAMNQVRAKLYEVVEQISKERQYDLVISNKNVISGAKSLDITAEALERIDASIAKIPLKVEAGE